MPPVESSKTPICFLFDNGSLRAEATLSLRETARCLARETGVQVQPVSLLHSAKVAPSELGGVPGKLLEPALDEYLMEHPGVAVVVLPLFFGPSGALTDYVPERLAFLRGRHPSAEIRLGRWLVAPGEGDERIAEALAAAVRKTMAERRLDRPRVVLVDHGSPQRAVTDVRNHLGRLLATLLGGGVAAVEVASMERRSGPKYAFNDPLLAERLRTAPFDGGDVIVALQFLSPGRHAGPEGDVAAICAGARSERPALRTHLTDTIANDPRVVAVLADRYREAVSGRGGR